MRLGIFCRNSRSCPAFLSSSRRQGPRRASNNKDLCSDTISWVPAYAGVTKKRRRKNQPNLIIQPRSSWTGSLTPPTRSCPSNHPTSMPPKTHSAEFPHYQFHAFSSYLFSAYPTIFFYAKYRPHST